MLEQCGLESFPVTQLPSPWFPVPLGRTTQSPRLVVVWRPQTASRLGAKSWSLWVAFSTAL